MATQLDPVSKDVPSATYSTTKLIKVLPSDEGFPNRKSGSPPLTLPRRNEKGTAYANANPDFQPSKFSNVLKWRFGDNGGLPKPAFPCKKEADEKLPTVDVDQFALNRFSPFGCNHPQTSSVNQLTATWTGHASFIVTAGGYTILTDPVWSDRASPIQCMGPKRMVPPSVPLDQLPYIDVVTISHNHYDHLDTMTVKHLIQHNHPLAYKRANQSLPSETKGLHPIFVVPYGMKTRWFSQFESSLPELDLDKVVEIMWWDTADLTNVVQSNKLLAGGSTLRQIDFNLTIAAVPVQHWSLRSGFDNNLELWGGYVYNVTHKSNPALTKFKFFHSGDTGYYDKIFEEIGVECGPFDFAMIPIGAYEPRFVMRQQHIDPFEAVEIHEHLKSRHSAGMHWGTFILTDEPIDEAPKVLAAAMAHKYGSFAISDELKLRDDDHNTEKIRALRKNGNFLLDTSNVPLTLDSGNNAFPFFACDRPFRALKHGETWIINESKQ
eukprot:GILI01008849.1.p1 GENE.GILI01008849.1~~GILI01008849.1.p1  ORF type:complete len:508 (+),score=35.01 GILI01008849.1:46-1524(+)